MVNVTPAIILDDGRIVKRGDMLRIETTNEGAVVGRFINAVMDLLNDTRFNIRVIREDTKDMETVAHRYITDIKTY